MIAATLNVNAALQSILPQLPKDTTFIVKRMDPTVFTIIAYSLTSDTLSAVDLKDIALYQITPLLTPIPGVARIEVQGGAVAEIQVLVDPIKLDAFGFALTDVATAITNANSLTALGKVEDYHKLYLVMSNNTMSESEQIRDTVVRADQRSVVRVRDVAEVRDGTLKEWVRTFADRKIAVLFQIYMQPDGNAVEIAQQVHDKLDKFSRTLPAGVHLANWYDQSVLVIQSAKTVRDAVLIGLFLSAIVLFLFLRSLSTILVAVLVVPATLLSFGDAALAHGPELQHHDARRHRRSRRPDHRRRDRHGRAHRPPCRCARCPGGPGSRARGRPARRQGIHAAADGIEPRDHDRVRPAGIPWRAGRRLCQGAVDYHGMRARRFLSHGRFRGANPVP